MRLNGEFLSANSALSSASGALMSASYRKEAVLTSKKRREKSRTAKTETGYEGFYFTVFTQYGSYAYNCIRLHILILFC